MGGSSPDSEPESRSALSRATRQDIIYSSGTTGVRRHLQAITARAAACANLGRRRVLDRSHLVQQRFESLVENFGLASFF